MTKPVYLDNAASTATRPEVLEAMLPMLTDEGFGNPSSPHRFGRAARAAIEHARRQIADAVGAEPNQVIFTSGGTEADNLAVIGGALAARDRGGPFRVAVSEIEHKAVLAGAKAVEHLGGEAIVIPVDATGDLEPEAVERALEQGVAVLSAMWVNNEVGIVRDVRPLAAQASAAGAQFHTDAVQAVGKIPCSIADFPCSFFALAGHKIGGPMGSGALIVRDPTTVESLIHGGGQQSGIRPGTENVAAIVGLGRAVELATSELDIMQHTVGGLRDDLERRLLEAVPDAEIVGAEAVRAPHISNVTIPGTDSESMLMHLDLAGIACSSGSACTTGSVEPSHVLIGLGIAPDTAITALRFSFSKQNTAADVDRVLEVLPGVVEKVRKLGAVLGR